MAVPILKQGPFLIATIQAALTDTDVLQLRDDVMAQVTRHRSRGIQARNLTASIETPISCVSAMSPKRSPYSSKYARTTVARSSSSYIRSTGLATVIT